MVSIDIIERMDSIIKEVLNITTSKRIVNDLWNLPTETTDGHSQDNRGYRENLLHNRDEDISKQVVRGIASRFFDILVKENGKLNFTTKNRCVEEIQEVLNIKNASSKKIIEMVNKYLSSSEDVVFSEMLEKARKMLPSFIPINGSRQQIMFSPKPRMPDYYDYIDLKPEHFLKSQSNGKNILSLRTWTESNIYRKIEIRWENMENFSSLCKIIGVICGSKSPDNVRSIIGDEITAKREIGTYSSNDDYISEILIFKSHSRRIKMNNGNEIREYETHGNRVDVLFKKYGDALMVAKVLVDKNIVDYSSFKEKKERGDFD